MSSLHAIKRLWQKPVIPFADGLFTGERLYFDWDTLRAQLAPGEG